MSKIDGNGLFSRRPGIASVLAAALLFLGSACAVEESDAEESQQTSVPEGEAEGEAEGEPRDGDTTQTGSTGVCSIDYSCPTTGDVWTGTKYGSFTIAQAYSACNTACAVACKSSGLICD